MRREPREQGRKGNCVRGTLGRVSRLVEHNRLFRREVVRLRDDVRERHVAVRPPSHVGHPLSQLRSRLMTALGAEFGRADIQWLFDSVDRAKFGADFTLRSPSLLREHGAKAYIAAEVPRIVAALGTTELKDLVAEISHKGIYVNIRLDDRWFLQAVQYIIDTGDQYGHSDYHADRTYVIDYSSPNVAKVLHAGHFRSTMIGHVLGNLFEANGSLVYRLNHINDFGGFGFILEGFRRFSGSFPQHYTNSQKLVEVYSLRRALERAAAGATDTDGTSLLSRYFPEATSPTEFAAALADYTAASDLRFTALENGDPDEVTLWREMVAWSIQDFQSFYTALDIDIDFVIGESFYAAAGNEVVERAIAAGTAYEFTRERAAAATAALDTAVADESMTVAARNKAAELLVKDIGAVVVPLPNGERLVVRRRDGRSIYATRDVGALQVRRDLFEPTDILYVVGQEQQVHFTRLFQAGQVLGIVDGDIPRLKHIYFGFYVDAQTGRKLSSRESVAGVTELLQAAVTHFRQLSAENSEMSDEELDQAAHQLAVGSVVFNDLRSDMKGTVSIPRGDLTPILADFEKSGGPYVVYSACRARAILRKYAKPVPRLADITDELVLNDQEVKLITALLELPTRVIKAAEETNPAVLVRHLLDSASIYNSYYASAPVLTGGTANLSRLMITKAAQLALTNGLRICHIECPLKI